jgi:hypothetical protein
MVELQEQAKQLDSVTDRVQEKEVDATKAQQAMSLLGGGGGGGGSGASQQGAGSGGGGGGGGAGAAPGAGTGSADGGSAAAAAAALSQLYTAQDVELIVDELEVTSEAAERALRKVAASPTDKMKSGEDTIVVAALRMLVTSSP